MKNRSLAFLACILMITLSIASCNSSTRSNETNNEQVADQATNDQENGTNVQQTKGILSTYFELKDALVATDAASAKKAAESLYTQLEGESHEVSETIAAKARAIADNDDIEAQRTYFFDLSEQMYAFVKASGDHEETIYKQYCPMAFNNQGAFWLSNRELVENPYFGDRMLHCGSVQETIAGK
ncbi:DUF3347 domain-containing protein [Fulvivirgaceae bacterium BMA10]|uniref:DUF3347 domain-containing protein n=1 Tax=Splendidivirga corallicola TaxID=3051826 RepID=A0ABT8KVI6_9BACT|nr:DUF3347 domain-containing protein [Fulvivirgaceae bacterium BMA10]